jgi:ankyrin repeat protein
LVALAAGVNHGDGSGATPLHYAVARGHEALVDALVRAGSDLTWRDYDGHAPIHVLARSSLNRMTDEKSARLTRALARDLDSLSMQSGGENEKGRTALHLAMARNRAQMMRALLDLDVSVDVRNGVGETALHEATNMAMQSMAGFLIDEGADLRAGTRVGDTPLHLAITSLNLPLAKYLVTRARDLGLVGYVNAANDSDVTALHIATRQRRDTTIRWLVSVGANPHLSDASGETPLGLARAEGRQDLVDIMLRHR